MEKALEAFQRELPTIQKIVNGYLASNPELAGYVMAAINIKPVAKDMNFIRKEGEKHFLNLAEPSLISLDSCRICKNSRGEFEVYCGPDGCPSF